MTLQEAKDQIANQYQYPSWDTLDFYAIDAMRATTDPPYAEERLWNEAAELYARSKWDECHKETCDLFSETMKQSLVFESYAGFAANMTKPEFKP